MLKYIGTRGYDNSKPNRVSFSDAILSPSACFGGLYVPNQFELYSTDRIKKFTKLSYQDLAFEILSLFGVDIDEDEIRYALMVYRKFDNPKNPAPVVKLNGNTFVQELWHGPTRAFKDMALEPFPLLLSYLAQQYGKNYLVATTTSGDTGPAALEGFKDLPNTKVIVYYPVDGTSKLQADQMKKASGNNVKVIGVRNTDFDGIQTKLKEMLKSDEINEKLRQSGFELTAANSVNFGRIIFQVVYHFWSYLELVRNGEIRLGEMVNYVIPSGNFGNALGAFYARGMGLPIKKIILASNENNVLTDFVNTGIYDIQDRQVLKTNSPAMDIKISSNVERVLHYLFGEKRTFELMEDLEKQKHFELTVEEKSAISEIFSADYATDIEVQSEINSIFYDYKYLIDPHTATAFVVRDKLELRDKSIIVSTAEWTKFSETIAKSFSCNQDFGAITSKLGVYLPHQISELEKLPILHNTVIEKEDMFKELLNFVGN